MPPNHAAGKGNHNTVVRCNVPGLGTTCGQCWWLSPRGVQWSVVCTSTLNRVNWSFAISSIPLKHFWLQMEVKLLSQPRQAMGHIFPGLPQRRFSVRLLLKPGLALRSIAAVKHACAAAFPALRHCLQALEFMSFKGEISREKQYSTQRMHFSSIFPGLLCSLDFSDCKH